MQLNTNKKQVVEWVVTGLLLLFGFYNQLAQLKGWAHIEVGDAQLTQLVTWVYELIIGLWAYWHNNNVTKDAGLSQDVLAALKDGAVTQSQVNELLKKD